MLERSNSDVGDMPVLSDAGAYSRLVGMDCLPVRNGTVTEGFVERLTGRFNADNVGPCAPVDNNFPEDTRFLILTKRIRTLPWLESPCQVD